MTPPTRAWALRRRSTGIGVLAATVLAGLVPLGAATAGGAPPMAADLRADTNRDGVVDVSGHTDLAGEDAWSSAAGAVFLANLDDDHRRCPLRGVGGRRLGDEELATCHDAADDRVNGPADLADLARLRTVPWHGAPEGATGSVTVRGVAAAHVRLFAERGAAGWVPITAGSRLSAAELRRGAVLAIEGRDVVRDRARWDGFADVSLTVTAGGRTTSDTVRLRLAPIVLQHHLQPVTTAFVTPAGVPEEWENHPERAAGRGTKDERALYAAMSAAMQAAGIRKPLQRLRNGDPWVQDVFEPGFMALPGPGGRPHVMRVVLRSANTTDDGVLRDAGREVFVRLRGPDVAAVQAYRRGVADEETDTLDSTGNVEVLPPVRVAGRTYPLGRILVGVGRPDNRAARPDPVFSRLLAGQQQPVLELDTSWLDVGHVDEFLHVVPATGRPGWKLAVSDPRLGLALLRSAVARGHGGVRLQNPPAGKRAEGPWTIAQALRDRDFVRANETAARAIDGNLRRLRAGAGISEADLIRVPALFDRYRGSGGGGGDSTAARAPSRRASADLGGLVPRIGNMVNGVSLAAGHYATGKPYGPVADGRHLFSAATETAFARAGVRVHWVPAWGPHQAGGGLHCVTNAYRATARAAEWWGR